MKTNTNKSRRKSWPTKNLKEVVSFLEMTHPNGYTILDVASALGMSGPKASSIFMADDMRLSVCENMARNLGFELRISFPAKVYMPLDKKNYTGAGNLAGLAKYMNEANRSITYIASVTGYSYDMIKRALLTGDIKVSCLYKISESLGIAPIWEWEKLTAREG